MKILVCVDGSEPALDAVRHALHLHHEGLRASFVLATVREPTFVHEMLLAPGAEVLEPAGGAGRSAGALDSAGALFAAAAVVCEREIGSGDPASTLLEIAARRGCTAVVMGARGMGRLRSALLGSVSHAVVCTPALPVTIVRHRAVDDGVGRSVPPGEEG